MNRRQPAAQRPRQRVFHPADTGRPRTTSARIVSDDEEAGHRITSITRRYDGSPMPDGVMYRQGNTNWYVHNGPPPVPARASARARTTEQYAIPNRVASLQKNPARRFHWLFFVGLGLLVMLGGSVALGAIGSWWTTHQNDAAYGYPRTYQCSAVVGHGGDSEANPSHFTVENLRGHIIIIELPAGSVAKALIYSGPTLVGNGQDLTPVTLSFADANGDGRPDMIVHIDTSTLVWLNNGSKFVPPSGGQ